jgi:hypothetical protein
MDTPTDGPTAERLALLRTYEDAEEIMSRLGALSADLATLLEGRDAERAELTIKDAMARTHELSTLMNKRMSTTMQ